MTYQNVIDFIKEHPLTYVATVEENKPRVRAFVLWFVDETGIYLQTSTIKSTYKQLQENPNIELCFFKQGSSPMDMGETLRVSGEAEFVDTPEFRKKLFQDRPFLKQFGLSEESLEVKMFRLKKGEAHFWTKENNLKEKEIIKFDL